MKQEWARHKLEYPGGTSLQKQVMGVMGWSEGATLDARGLGWGEDGPGTDVEAKAWRIRRMQTDEAEPGEKRVTEGAGKGSSCMECSRN